MSIALPDNIRVIYDFARAREILLLDAAGAMPGGARAQRERLINTLQNIIDRELALIGSLPPVPESFPDRVSQQAWQYMASRSGKLAPADITSDNAYQNLVKAFDENNTIAPVGDLIYWCRETKTLPEVDNDTMNDVMTSVASYTSKALKQPHIRQWLEEARQNQDALSPDDKLNFKKMEEEIKANDAIPDDLNEAWIRAGLEGGEAWQTARDANDFNLWLPHFEQMVG